MAVQPTDPEALLLYQLIGAPMLAVIQAEAQAAQVSADFITRIGFVPILEAPVPGGEPTAAAPPAKRTERQLLQAGGEFGALRTAQFALERKGADGQVRTHTLSIPVLSLFPIPLLQVKDAEFDFDVRILTRVPLQDAEEQRNDVSTRTAVESDFLSPQRVELKGVLAPRSSSDTGSLQMGIRMKVRMEQSDMPAGLLKLLGVMEESVRLEPVTPKRDV